MIGDSLDRQMLVFSGRSNPNFTEAVCNALSLEIGRMEVLRFSDGELSVEISDNVRGRDVFIIQSISAPGNDHLMELLITLDALKRSSAGRITAVIPYFGYSRQDRKVKPRVPITAKLVADLISTAGAHRVLTIDLHAGQIMGFFDIPVDNLYALPIMIPYVERNFKGHEIVIVSPDMGGVERARLFATRLGNVSIAVIDKRRSGPNQIVEMNVVGDVAGKIAIIVDDIVDTGGTLIKASEVLLSKGALKVSACCVHPVLSGNAITNIENSAIDSLIITDTIPVPRAATCPKIKILSVAPLFAEAIRRVHRDDSVSSLFR